TRGLGPPRPPPRGPSSRARRIHFTSSAADVVIVRSVPLFRRCLEPLTSPPGRSCEQPRRAIREGGHRAVVAANSFARRRRRVHKCRRDAPISAREAAKAAFCAV